MYTLLKVREVHILNLHSSDKGFVQEHMMARSVQQRPKEGQFTLVYTCFSYTLYNHYTLSTLAVVTAPSI